jgi:hypothetical protein
VTLPVSSPTIRYRRGTAERWFELNPVLRSGEPGYELDTGRFKVGDGVSEWEDLPYFTPTATASSAEAPPTESVGSSGALLAHIYSEDPHPAYDDGPSLLLLYQNAKV